MVLLALRDIDAGEAYSIALGDEDDDAEYQVSGGEHTRKQHTSTHTFIQHTRSQEYELDVATGELVPVGQDDEGDEESE